MIVVIDNYDSFTYNLVQYLGELGNELAVFRNDKVSIETIEQLAPSHIVISPGPGTPEADSGISNQVIAHFQGRVPILGVCLGHQCIAHTFGGQVVRAPRLMHGKTSRVLHQGDRLFAGIPRSFTATRYHSLIVQDPVPDTLEVMARTAEGEIMAIKHRDSCTIGVQFHPESILTPHGKRLLQNFVQMTNGQSASVQVETMTLPQAIEGALQGQHLSVEQAQVVMDTIMSGSATPAQIGAYLAALRAKGETVAEITGFAQAMRQHVTAVHPARYPLVDTCGTGGDGAHTINVSTTAALVAAGAGLAVAKHGNRSVSSQCGSADLLEALGVNLDLTPEQVARSIDEVGFGFLFAPKHHPAMKYAIGPRREMGVRTVFNILGPLTNPAGASVQMLGVYDQNLVETLAQVLLELGSEAAYVVHSADGLDELSVTAVNHVAALKDGHVRLLELDPARYGLKRATREQIRGGNAQQNAEYTLQILRGEAGPMRDMVVLNAGMALCAADVAGDVLSGLAQAAESIDSGRALNVLHELVAFTQGVS